MRRLSRFLPILGGAVAGGAIALAVASGNTSTTHSSTTTTVIQQSRGAGVPTSLSSTKGETINQIYRTDSPGVVDITVTSQTNTPGFGPFGGGGTQQT